MQQQFGSQALPPSLPAHLPPQPAFTVGTNSPLFLPFADSTFWISISGSLTLKPTGCVTHWVTLPLWAIHQCSPCQDGHKKKRHRLGLRYAEWKKPSMPPCYKPECPSLSFMNVSLTHKIRESEKKISTLKQIFSVKLTIFLLNSRVYKGNADTTLTLAAQALGLW